MSKWHWAFFSYVLPHGVWASINMRLSEFMRVRLKGVLALVMILICFTFKCYSNSVNSSLTNCRLSLVVMHFQLIECYIEVLDQAWMAPRYQLLQHRCQPSAEAENTLYFHQHDQARRNWLVLCNAPCICSKSWHGNFGKDLYSYSYEVIFTN